MTKHCFWFLHTVHYCPAADLMMLFRICQMRVCVWCGLAARSGNAVLIVLFFINTAYDDLHACALIKLWCIQAGVVVLAYFDNRCILGCAHLIFSGPTHIVIPGYATDL